MSAGEDECNGFSCRRCAGKRMRVLIKYHKLVFITSTAIVRRGKSTTDNRYSLDLITINEYRNVRDDDIIEHDAALH